MATKNAYLMCPAVSKAALGVLLLLAPLGCDRPAQHRSHSVQSRGRDVEIYLQGVAATLNDLPEQVDLDLLPAQQILTASTSADGKEVRATCTRNPEATPDGLINYLRAVDGNANFYTLDVQPGDIVRYYVNVDQEVAERGIEQRTAIELRVRRLDARDMQNALIVEGGLTDEVLVPQRIEIWRYSDKRMDAIRSALNRYEKLRQPPVGWEPTPDLAALHQIIENSNQWLRSQPAVEGQWRIDPLIDGLPPEVRAAKGVAETMTPQALEAGLFAESEGRLLEQAVWFRDIAQWAGGNSAVDSRQQVAAALFDWTVRNIQLDRNDDAASVYHPWQALVYGHGSAEHRAWVFIELCRQMGIDAVVLRPAAAADGESPAPLLVAAIVDDQLYPFDPRLGLPLLVRDGNVGSLQDLAAHPELLRELDVAGEFQCPLDQTGLESLEAYIAASPLQLSRRSTLLESGLEGENFVKLSVDASELAERVQAFPQVTAVGLWPLPFVAQADQYTVKPSVRQRAVADFEPFAVRPLLWKARVLHFQGDKDVRAEERSDPLADPRNGHQDAVALYQDPTVRPPNATLAKLEPAKQRVYSAAKADASYWMGLLSYERGAYDVAAAWLDQRTLKTQPKGRWADGARYNLARTYEAQGEIGRAMTLLESDPPAAPQRHGNLVRAKRLRQAAPAGPLRP